MLKEPVILQGCRGKTPLEILNSQAEWYSNPLNDHWITMLFGASGVACSLYMNTFSRRPLYSGLNRTFGYCILGAVFGYFANDRRNNYYAKKDAVVRQYVELHPEDFVMPARKQFKDLLLTWRPCR